jgi:hypothetical protein
MRHLFAIPLLILAASPALASDVTANCTDQRDRSLHVTVGLSSGSVSVYDDGVLVNGGTGEFEQDCGDDASGNYSCLYSVSSATLRGWVRSTRSTRTGKDSSRFNLTVRRKNYQGKCS